MGFVLGNKMRWKEIPWEPQVRSFAEARLLTWAPAPAPCQLCEDLG